MIDPEAQSCVNAVVAAAESLDRDALVACLVATICQHAGIDPQKIKLPANIVEHAPAGLKKMHAAVMGDYRRFNAGNN
jgi:hypothetical protein